MSLEGVEKALIRLADANFQQAKAIRQYAKAIEHSVELQERAQLVQETQARVSSQLEQLLMAQGRGNS